MAQQIPNVRRLARRRDVDGLVQALGYADWLRTSAGEEVDLGVEVRLQAVLALAELNHPAAISALIELTIRDEDHERVTSAAHEALAVGLRRAVIGQPVSKSRRKPAPEGLPAADHLAMSVLLTDDQVIMDNATYIREALGADEDADARELAVATLLKMLADSRPEVVRRARDMIVVLGPSRLQDVITLMHDPSRAVAAAHLLGQLRDNRALGDLSEALHRGDPALRRSCVWALGELTDSGAVSDLIAATTDADYEVRVEAFAALDKLGPAGVIGGMTAALLAFVSRIPLPAPPLPELPPAPLGTPNGASASAPRTVRLLERGRSLRRTLRKTLAP